MAKMVTIKGTWSRTNTSRAEVYEWRQTLRRRARRFGGSLEYKLPQDQKDEPEGVPGWGTKSGTFTATVPLRSNYCGQRRNENAALQVVKAVLTLELCRLPKLKLDRSATYMRNNDSMAPVI